jgi:hypothetical protein
MTNLATLLAGYGIMGKRIIKIVIGVGGGVCVFQKRNAQQIT